MQGGASTQPRMVESSMNTPVRINGQTFTSNLMIEKADLQNKTALHIDIKTRNQLDHLMTTADRYTLQEMIFTIKPPGEV
ncbi:hypothetical protein NC651_017383 [Populus alba x Populus x berolinensis]|nr:hypothetical protein NC651_017383 [Populus alba x Populus x berolinensis]